jgi:hypothetical protein
MVKKRDIKNFGDDILQKSGIVQLKSAQMDSPTIMARFLEASG